MHRATGARAIQNPDRINPGKTNFYSERNACYHVDSDCFKTRQPHFYKGLQLHRTQETNYIKQCSSQIFTEKDISTLDLRIKVPNNCSLLTCERQSNMAYVVYPQGPCVFQPSSVANSKSSLRSLTFKLKFQNIENSFNSFCKVKLRTQGLPSLKIPLTCQVCAHINIAGYVKLTEKNVVNSK